MEPVTLALLFLLFLAPIAVAYIVRQFVVISDLMVELQYERRQALMTKRYAARLEMQVARVLGGSLIDHRNATDA